MKLTNTIFRIVGILFLSLWGANSYAQLDTKHYIPPVFGREDYGCHYLVLSTPSDIPFDVTIKDGSGNFIATQTISSFASSTYNLGCGNTTQLLTLESELNTVLTDKGFILEANEPFYSNLRIIAGPQAGSLTSKGVTASLGTDFRAGFMYNNDGQDWRKSNTIGILATEDNTQINFTDIRPGVVFEGTTPTGSPLTSPDINITLNAGESYVIAAYLDNPDAIENTNGMNGIHVTSDKPIVMNTATWLGGNALQSGSPSTGRDLGIDQIVSSEHIGSEYVVLKGEGIDNEKVIIVPAQDGTDIFLNGNSTAIATVDAGDFYVINDTEFSANENLFIETSNDAYVYQTANGGNGATDDNERQCGLNFLPPVGCTGGKAVFLPNVDFIGEAQINIIADAGATVYVDGVDVGTGDPVSGTSEYVTYKLNNNYSGDIEVTSDKLIRVSLINLSGHIGAAGYFSGFTKDIAISTQSINSDNIAKEGCVNGEFHLFIGSPSPLDTEIEFTIAGTATNGIDYEFIDNSVIIPAGQTSASITIEAIQDGFAEGQESIYLIYEPEICSGLDTAFLYIDDAEPIEFTIVPTDLSCFEDNSGEIFFNATGGTSPYTYYIEDEDHNITQTLANPTGGLAAGTYTVQVYDVYGCKAEAIVVGGQFDAGTTFLPDGSGVTYTSVLPISGFGAGETITDMSQLQQICANIEHSFLGDLRISIIAPSGETVILKDYNGGGGCFLGEPVDNNGTEPGVGYDYCFNDSPDYGTMVSEVGNYSQTFVDNIGVTRTGNYLPAGAYTSVDPLSNLLGATKNGDWTIEVTDHLAIDNGYIFYWNISLLGEYPDTIAHIFEPEGMNITANILQSTCGENNGAIDLTVTGAIAPYTFEWSNGELTEDLGAIPSGSYTVTVTDGNGCFQTETFLLNSNSSLSGTASISDSECYGGNTGSIDLSVTGGTAPYTYLWETGATTEDISDLSAGDYIVTIYDAGACQAVESFSVGENDIISISSNIIENEICGTTNGSINIEVQGGSGAYGYEWSTGDITQDISGISGGSYTLTITDGFNCQVTSDFTVQNDVSNCSSYCFLTIDSDVTDDNCGNNQGAIDVTIVDATNPYIVEWSTGETIEDLNNLAEGDYTITVTDANNCIEIATISVGNNTGTLSISNSSINNELCGGNDGSIDITIAGGTLPYTYLWSNGAITEDISGLSEGNYQIEIRDGNNCELTQSFEIENNTGSLAATEIIVHEVCGNSQGSIDLTVTGNNGALSYLWSNGSNLQDISGLNAGSYSCTISDASGCELITNYIINNSASDLAIINSLITNETCGQTNGAIDIVVSGGDGNYTYLWSNDSITEDIYGLSEGSYHLIVTDGNGCQVSTGSMYVFNTGDDLSISTALAIDEVCGNSLGSIDVDVTGGDGSYSYNWNTGASSQDLINISEGTYSLTVTDGNNCQQTFSESISNDNGTLSLDNTLVTNEDCGQANGSISQMISGGTTPYSFAWNTGLNTQNLTALSEGTYQCTISDVNGCEVLNSIDINNNTGDLSVTHAATAEICSNSEGAIDLTVSGSATPFTLAWSNGSDTEDLSNISAGTYSCVITDNNGCSVQTGDITIINNASDLSTTAYVANDTCSNSVGYIELTTTGGTLPYTFVWSNSINTEDNYSLSEGSYSYTLSDANGCEIIESFNIANESGSMLISSQIVSNELCNDGMGAIDLTINSGTEPYSFIWSNGSTTEDISGLNEGQYTCTISDANGCELVSNSFQVNNEAGDLAIQEIITVDEVCGNSEGTINLTVAGTATPLTFAWDNGDNTEDISGLSAGIYTVVITDANGCSLSSSITVNNEAGNLAIYETNIEDEACNQGNGSIDIFVVGGTPSYNFTWSNGATSEDISNLSSGAYSLLVSDQNGCTKTYSTNIENVGANFAITSVTSEDEICSNAQGLINITVENGSNPYSYTWSNGASSEDIDNLSAGTYDVVVNDANGCTTTESYTILNNTGTLSLDGFDITHETCGQANGIIDLTYSGGNEPVAINWSNGGFEEDLEDISAGFYSVTISDQYGCSLSESGTVENITGGFAITTQTFVNSVCSDSLGSIDITMAGGALPYTFNWSNGANTEDISNLWAGDYTLSVSDANGCEIVTSQTIINETTGIEITNAYTGDDNCSSNQGYIDLVVSGGVTPYTFDWSNGDNTEDLVNITEGDYFCIVTDNAGCSVVSETYTISNTASNLTASSISSPVICTTLGSIDLTPENGFMPYQFNWDNAETTEDIYNLSIGTYVVTITDASGCITVHSQTVGEEPNDLFATASYTDVICNTRANLNLNVYNGTAPYSFIWSNGATTEDLSNLDAGTYAVSISDINGCEHILSRTIDSTQSNIMINFNEVNNEICTNGQGSIHIIPIGGLAPLNVLWSNSETENSIYNLSAGDYSVTVTDGHGCEETNDYTVYDDPGSLNIDTALAHHINCVNTLGWIDLSYSGGTEPVSIAWDHGEIEEDPEDLVVGMYYVTIADANGCEDFASAEIFNYDDFEIISTSVIDDTCSQSIGSIDLTASGGMQPLTYTWDNGEATEDISNLAGGYYQCLVSTADGCELSTGNLFIDNVDGFFLSEYITHSSCSTCNDGEIDITITGSGSDFTYVWTGPNDFTADTEDITGLIPGEYSLVVTNDLGCQMDLTFTVSFNSLIGDVDSNIEITAWPNPTNSILNIEYNTMLGISQIKVVNIIGQEVKSIDVSQNKGLHNLDLSSFARGIYHIKLISNKEVYSLKVMYQE
jgi:subtilisin-like proprotein convertase family protein